MITISLCMIVRNEEAVLARCLSSVSDIVDEIIIVDTGSTDRTMEIARSFGAKIYEKPWTDHFAEARNASFDKAAMDYILWLDADDVIDPENKEAFIALKETLDDTVDAVMMRYHVAFDVCGQPTYTFYRERLLQRAHGFRWLGRVHEAIVTDGIVIRSQIAIRHEKKEQGTPDRNLRIYEKMIAEGEVLEPRHRYYYARELFANERTAEAIALLQQCIDDPETWVENRISACRDLSACLINENKIDEALKALMTSFLFGEPRAEICCDIGKIFISKCQYPAAIFWYHAAPTCTPSEASGGFALPECRGYIPYMQLCLCYDHMSEYALAEAYNEKAAQFKECDKAIETNRSYFTALRAKLAKERQ